MENNQQTFIQTIRQALGKLSGKDLSDPFGPAPEHLGQTLQAYLNNSRTAQKDLIQLFITQASLAHIRTSLVKTAQEAALYIRDLIQNTDPEWGKQKSVMAWDHPLIDKLCLDEILADTHADLFFSKTLKTPDNEERQAFREKLIQSYIGITSADYCVAQSATLVMRTRPGQPRAVSLVPSIHVAVIQAGRIIKDLKELYFRLRHDPREKDMGIGNCMTLISGPSKTADIELEMVFGAHGPRELHVCIIENDLSD